MTIQKNEWHYFDENKGQWIGPFTLADLHHLRSQGVFEDYTPVLNSHMLRRQGPGGRGGIPYSSVARLDVEFKPSIEDFYASRINKPTTILSGPNNSGKTLLLKQVFANVGHSGYLVACSRFSHVDSLNTREQNENEHRQYYDNFIQNYYTSRQNAEENELKLEQIITGLKNTQREHLFTVCKDLLGNELSLKRTDPNSDFSPYYVDMDGENIRYGSSGTRLLLTLLGILLDDRFSVLLIDEPELGLSPRIQSILARFMYDPEHREKFFPHLRQLYIATHSHLFLDRSVFSNNYLPRNIPFRRGWGQAQG